MIKKASRKKNKREREKGNKRVSYQLFLLGHKVAVVVRSTTVSRIASSTPARNKYFYNLEVVVPGLSVCVCEFTCL